MDEGWRRFCCEVWRCLLASRPAAWQEIASVQEARYAHTCVMVQFRARGLSPEATARRLDEDYCVMPAHDGRIVGFTCEEIEAVLRADSSPWARFEHDGLRHYVFSESVGF